MTNEEAAELVALLTAATPTPAWPIETMRLYARRLRDLQHDVASEVVNTWIDTHGAAIADRPGIGDLRKAAVLAQDHERWIFVEPDEAWSIVQMAAKTATRISNTYALVAIAAERFGWADLVRSTNPGVDRAHFLQIYRALYERTLDECAASPGAKPQCAHWQQIAGREQFARVASAGPRAAEPLPGGDRRRPLGELVQRAGRALGVVR